MARQFRYVMPLGFGAMLLSVIVNYKRIELVSLFHAMIQLPSLLFFLLGMAGILVMVRLGKRKDDSARANWIEQGVNSVAQLGFLLGILFIVI